MQRCSAQSLRFMEIFRHLNDGSVVALRADDGQQVEVIRELVGWRIVTYLREGQQKRALTKAEFNLLLLGHVRNDHDNPANLRRPGFAEHLERALLKSPDATSIELMVVETIWPLDEPRVLGGWRSYADSFQVFCDYTFPGVVSCEVVP